MTTDRVAQSHGPRQDITAALAAAGPGAYWVQAWGRLRTGSGGPGRAQIVITDDSGTHYFRSNGTWSAGWSSFAAMHALTWTGTLQGASFNVASNEVDADLLVDACSVRQ